MSDKEFGSFKLLKLKYRRGDKITELFCRIGSPEEIRFLLFNLKKFRKAEKSTTASSSMHWNLMNNDEFGSFKGLKLKYRLGGRNNWAVLQNGSPQEIRSPFFHLRKFRKAEKSTAESCRRHWNLKNDKEFRSFKLLKSKYRRENQIIQPFCRIGSPPRNEVLPL